MSFSSSHRPSRLGGEDSAWGQSSIAASSSSNSGSMMSGKPARNGAVASECVPEKEEGGIPEPKRRRSASPLSDHVTARSTAGQDGAPRRGETGQQHLSNESTAKRRSYSGVVLASPNNSNAARKYSGQLPPDTSRPGSSASQDSLAHLSSWTAIAKDLPQGSELSPRAPTSPLSGHSIRSRGSASSRGSSPHAPSSSSSNSRGRRRYGSDAPQTPSRSASQVPDYRYELIIHQQPGTAAAAGLNPPALSRLPIVPSPILQLRVTDEKGLPVGHRFVLQNLPYLVCSCSLVSADGIESVDFADEEQELPAASSSSRPISSGRPAGGRRPSQPLAMLCGTRVYSAAEALDMDNQEGIFFVFWDVSVRQIGEFRLKFSLIEALPGSPTLATVISQAFTVVQRSGFPGAVEIATPWTRHLHRQGLSIYLPALGTSSTPSTSLSASA